MLIFCFSYLITTVLMVSKSYFLRSVLSISISHLPKHLGELCKYVFNSSGKGSILPLKQTSNSKPTFVWRKI